MPWKTTDLTALKSSEYWNTFPEGFKQTIVEEKVYLPSWRTKIGFPLGTIIDTVSRKIIFEKSVGPMDLEYVYNSTTKTWIYLQSQSSNPNFAGTWLDDKTFQPNTAWSTSDKLYGSLWATVEFDDPMRNGKSYSDSPIEWSLPVVLLDPKQINDKKTYDGGFPINVVEMSVIAAITKLGNMAIWARITDLVDFPMSGTVVTKQDDALTAKVKKYEDLITELKTKLANV